MTLTVEDLRVHVGPGPDDDVLDLLLTAAYGDIEQKYGPVDYDGTVTELLMPSGSIIVLSRRASEITSIKEGTDDALEEEDYELRPGGKYVRRLDSSLNPQAWTALVDVTYTPLNDEEAQRDRIAVALVRLDLNHNPGLTGRSISSWAEQYSQSRDTYADERAAILASLRPAAVGVW